jgi:dihydropteroate synthase
VDQAGLALAEGADLLDVTHCPPETAAAIGARYPDAVWPGTPAGPDPAAAPGPPSPAALVDADLVAAGVAGGDAPVAAVAAVAAISTWLGAAAVRTRHVRAARRAIDMTSSIAGHRPPALTTRGLA